jgi:uncharacterized protein with ATP-grasp and redox domains
MYHRPDCIPCILRRVLHTAERSTADEWLQRRILGGAMQELARVDDKATPAEVVHSLSRLTAKTLGVSDPYLEEKHRWVQDCVSNSAWIRSTVGSGPEAFRRSVHLAGVANVLDCELREDIAPSNHSLRTIVEGFETVPFVADAVDDLQSAVRGAERVLFVHDTAAELFFDRLLIEALGKSPGRVSSVVREQPILADATREDAEAVGLEDVARVLTTGFDCLGLPLNDCSAELRDAYRKADLVIAKGQAAYQTLDGKDAWMEGTPKTVFFLLRVKCPVMARHMGVAVGDCVLEGSWGGGSKS